MLCHIDLRMFVGLGLGPRKSDNGCCTNGCFMMFYVVLKGSLAHLCILVRLFHRISFAVACNWVSLVLFPRLFTKWSCSCDDFPNSCSMFSTKFRREKCGPIFFFPTLVFNTNDMLEKARWLNTSRLNYRPLDIVPQWRLNVLALTEWRMISADDHSLRNNGIL